MPMVTLGDERVALEREERARLGREERNPMIQKWIDQSRKDGDPKFRYALNQWVLYLKASPRFSTVRPQKIKLPELIQQALELPSQFVLIDERDRLWTLVGKAPDQCLLP